MIYIADLFCGAGGAAMGIHRAMEAAGYRYGDDYLIVGFDTKKQPRYPFEFILQDALTVDLRGFAGVWASPPCQHYSRLRHLPWLTGRQYWRSIPPTRDAIQQSGLPYIIENVADAAWDMRSPSILCGQSLGMSLYRHRAFECSFLVMTPPHQPHKQVITPGRASISKRHGGMQGFGSSGLDGISRQRTAMGIDWMTGQELGQAIPPAYSAFLWQQMIPLLGS